MICNAYSTGTTAKPATRTLVFREDELTSSRQLTYNPCLVNLCANSHYQHYYYPD